MLVSGDRCNCLLCSKSRTCTKSSRLDSGRHANKGQMTENFPAILLRFILGFAKQHKCSRLNVISHSLSNTFHNVLQLKGIHFVISNIFYIWALHFHRLEFSSMCSTEKLLGLSGQACISVEITSIFKLLISLILSETRSYP